MLTINYNEENIDDRESHYLVLTKIDAEYLAEKRGCFVAYWSMPDVFGDAKAPGNKACMPAIYKDFSDQLRAYAYIDQVYEHFLIGISKSLNEFHNLSMSKRYWRMLIGPWLKEYLSVIYDRYFSILSASEKFPDSKVIICETAEFVAILNTKDFDLRSQTDAFNYKLCSRLIEEAKIQVKAHHKKIFITEKHPLTILQKSQFIRA